MATAGALTWILLLSVLCRAVPGSDCGNGSSVYEDSACLSCPACYGVVEAHYNATLRAHEEFMVTLQMYRNKSLSGASMLLKRTTVIYRAMLEEYLNVSLKTAAEERNLTSRLSHVHQDTVLISQRARALDGLLSKAANWSDKALAAHANNSVLLEELKIIVSRAEDVLRETISNTIRDSELVYNETLTKLDRLAMVVDTADNISLNQQSLSLAVLSMAEEALNLSSVALDRLCRSVHLHNITSRLAAELSANVTPGVLSLQQQITSLMLSINKSALAVVNRSLQLDAMVNDRVIPLYDTVRLGLLADEANFNVTWLADNVTMTAELLNATRVQIEELSTTVESVASESARLAERTDRLLNSSDNFLNLSQRSVAMGNPVITAVDQLLANLTEQSHQVSVFNSNLTRTVGKLNDTAAERVTMEAANETSRSQDDVHCAQRLLATGRDSLVTAVKGVDNVTSVVQRIQLLVTSSKDTVEEFTGVLEPLESNLSEDLDVVNESQMRISNDSGRLPELNRTSLQAVEALDKLGEQLASAKQKLAVVTGLPVPALQDTEPIKSLVGGYKELVARRELEVEEARQKVLQLRHSVVQLEDRYRQLQQHRDQLQLIRDNLSNLRCK